MAVKQVTQINCDRCGKTIEDGKAKDPTATHLIYVEGTLLTEATKIDFVDLCAKCESRAQTLLSQLRLDDSAKGDDGKTPVGDNAAAASSQKPSNPKEAKASAKT
jgi:hypothetical protein